MLRKRERFERTDVPKPSAFRNIIALGVLAVVALSTFVICGICWRKANQMNNLNDGALYDALYDQADVSGPEDGRAWSEDSFSNCLFLIVDDVNAEKPELKSAQLLVRDVTAGTMKRATLPINVKLTANESTTYLSALFAEGGGAAVLAPLTDAANVHVSHVIIASEDIWNQLGTFKGPGIKALFSKQTDDFATIASDMSTSDLVKFAEALQEIGIDTIADVDTPSWGDTLEDGTEVTVLDRQELPLALGIFYRP